MKIVGVLTCSCAIFLMMDDKRKEFMRGCKLVGKHVSRALSYGQQEEGVELLSEAIF